MKTCMAGCTRRWPAPWSHAYITALDANPASWSHAWQATLDADLLLCHPDREVYEIFRTRPLNSGLRCSCTFLHLCPESVRSPLSDCILDLVFLIAPFWWPLSIVSPSLFLLVLVFLPLQVSREILFTLRWASETRCFSFSTRPSDIKRLYVQKLSNKDVLILKIAFKIS